MYPQWDLGLLEASHTWRLIASFFSSLRAIEGETLDEYLVWNGEAGL